MKWRVNLFSWFLGALCGCVATALLYHAYFYLFVLPLVRDMP